MKLAAQQMESLPAEILFEIALVSPAAWRGLLVVRAFAEMSIKSRYIRAARKSFGLSLPWKKNYDFCLHRYNDSDYKEFVVLQTGMIKEIIATIKDLTRDKKTGPFVCHEILGKKTLRKLNSIESLCSKIGRVNKAEETNQRSICILPKKEVGWTEMDIVVCDVSQEFIIDIADCDYHNIIVNYRNKKGRVDISYLRRKPHVEFGAECEIKK